MKIITKDKKSSAQKQSALALKLPKEYQPYKGVSVGQKNARYFVDMAGSKKKK